MSSDWKTIEGYPNYEISREGFVERVAYSQRTGKSRYRMKPVVSKDDGYVRVQLRNEEGRSGFLLHRLVAQTFIPNPDNLPEVNHDDGDRKNCREDNLEWVTASVNQFHKARVTKTHHNLKEFTFRSPSGEIVNVDNLSQFCEGTNLSRSMMSRLHSGILEMYKGWTK